MKSYWKLLEDTIKCDKKLQNHLYMELGEQVYMYFADEKRRVEDTDEKMDVACSIADKLRESGILLLEYSYEEGKSDCWLVPLIYCQQKFRIRLLILTETENLIANIYKDLQDITNAISYYPQIGVLTKDKAYHGNSGDEVLITTTTRWKQLTEGITLAEYMKHQVVNTLIVKE